MKQTGLGAVETDAEGDNPTGDDDDDVDECRRDRKSENWEEEEPRSWDEPLFRCFDREVEERRSFWDLRSTGGDLDKGGRRSAPTPLQESPLLDIAAAAAAAAAFASTIAESLIDNSCQLSSIPAHVPSR